MYIMFCFKPSKITARTYALKLTSEEERMSRTQIFVHQHNNVSPHSYLCILPQKCLTAVQQPLKSTDQDQYDFIQF
jgi:hypothetical protein